MAKLSADRMLETKKNTELLIHKLQLSKPQVDKEPSKRNKILKIFKFIFMFMLLRDKRARFSKLDPVSVVVCSISGTIQISYTA